MHWLTLDWWKYLLADLGSPSEWWHEDRRWPWTTLWCRLRGHPSGPIWQNVGGLEPDMDCRDCGDRIG